MVTALVGQLVYYLPSLLAHGVALGAAALLHARHPRAALLLAAGTGAQLLASLVSFSLTAMLTTGLLSTASTLVYTAVGLLASLLRAAGELGVVAALWVALRGAPEPGGPDPYGFG